MSWASRTRSVDDLQREHDQAAADLEQLRERIAAGTADPSAITLAEYRVTRVAKALTRAVTDGGDAA